MPAATAALLAERADHPLYVASVEKGMRVLEAFDAARDSLSLTDIVQLTGMGKAPRSALPTPGKRWATWPRIRNRAAIASVPRWWN